MPTECLKNVTWTATIDGTEYNGEYNIAAYYEYSKALNNPALTSLVEKLRIYSISAELYREEAANAAVKSK